MTRIADCRDKLAHVARTAHEMHRTYCALVLGDRTLMPWDSSPQWMRDCCLAGVVNVREHPDITAEQAHEQWVRDKKADGWVHGDTKDLSMRTHPCLVAYDKLTPQQQYLDRLFLDVVKASLSGF